jgi:hypothetical protein
MSTPRGLIFEYGSYQHERGEVYPQMIEIMSVDSDRGYRWAFDYRMQIAGNFCQAPDNPLTPATIDAKILALTNAYANDYQDFGFLFGDLSRTSHYMETDHVDNLSGNKVLSRSWDYQSPAEFANTRSFQIRLGAKIFSSYSSILYFQETVSQRGTGGPRWNYQERWQGIPIREDITQRTAVEIYQRGIVVGANSFVQPPPPWWPDDEQQEFRYIERVSPRLHGHPSFAKATHHTVRYSYKFMMAVSPNQNPNIWYP